MTNWLVAWFDASMWLPFDKLRAGSTGAAHHDMHSNNAQSKSQSLLFAVGFGKFLMISFLSVHCGYLASSLTGGLNRRLTNVPEDEPRLLQRYRKVFYMLKTTHYSLVIMSWFDTAHHDMLESFSEVPLEIPVRSEHDLLLREQCRNSHIREHPQFRLPLGVQVEGRAVGAGAPGMDHELRRSFWQPSDDVAEVFQ